MYQLTLPIQPRKTTRYPQSPFESTRYPLEPPQPLAHLPFRLACPLGTESPYSLLPYPIQSPFRFSQHMIPLTLPTQQQLHDNHTDYHLEPDTRRYNRQHGQYIASQSHQHI
jgi:hypothetical protein